VNPRVLRRFIIIVAVTTFVMVGATAVVEQLLTGPRGDYEVRKGDILLTDGRYDEALVWFDRALSVSAGHRGAMMGRAIAFLQSNRTAEAEAELTALIDRLSAGLAADDATGRGVLAGAYANRGILRDRAGRFEEALADYRQGLAIDRGAVAGPGLFHKILYGNTRPATVEDRARYLADQLARPVGERVLAKPDVDARQRMHKP
jgi:tetratricopeptide (TPR) repeat protein